MIFLDTNIILRYLTWDDPAKAKRCDILFKNAAKGQESLYTTNLVINEIIWVLEKAYHVSKNETINYILHILNTPNLYLEDKEILISAVGLYELENIDFIDAYNVIFMECKNIKSIYSYDKDYDRFEEIKRIEP
jgi:predicted nucleic-acid-binding protein